MCIFFEDTLTEQKKEEKMMKVEKVRKLSGVYSKEKKKCQCWNSVVHIENGLVFLDLNEMTGTTPNFIQSRFFFYCV